MESFQGNAPKGQVRTFEVAIRAVHANVMRGDIMSSHKELTVLVTPAESVKGEWIAHVLDLDLITQGKSIEHALSMAAEAVCLVVADDLEYGLDPLTREKAPSECWELASRVRQHGCALTEVDPGKVRVVVSPLQLHFGVVQRRIHSGSPGPQPQHPSVELAPAVGRKASLHDIQSPAHC